MTDEVENLAVTPVPEQIATAAPESVVETPEAKSFSQEELDAAIGKRLAREQRKWERDQAQRQAEVQTLRSPSNDYSAEGNPDAAVLQKAEEIVARRDAAKQQSQVLDSYHERDAQRMYNYWVSQEAEMLALAPKAPFIGYGGQFEGYEDKWKTANTHKALLCHYHSVLNRQWPPAAFYRLRRVRQKTLNRLQASTTPHWAWVPTNVAVKPFLRVSVKAMLARITMVTT